MVEAAPAAAFVMAKPEFRQVMGVSHYVPYGQIP
jgi:hypothetical protein